MKGGVFAGEVTAAAIEEGNYSQKRLQEYQDKCEVEMVKTFKKELKVKNYLLNLSDEELDSIADAFKNTEFERISTKEIIKVLVKVSPKALLKLGKLF
jgi:digeranylgeranylglycerophospholipid reductase